MKYKHIKHIFFDLDHTLWDFDTNSELAFETILKENFPSINAKSFMEIYAPINQACWKLYQNEKITHQELKYNRFRETFDALNHKISDAEIDLISVTYLDLLPTNNTLFEGAIEILDYLKPNYKLHIITNGFAEVQDKKINNSGLKSYFETITNSENAGVKKPNPKIYEHALSLAKAEKEIAIMIGDCIDADVFGALNFGIEALFFNVTNNKVPENIIEINHLLELKKYF
jgi:YjjG family noncanonical pyrimidine nucleotidase